MKRKLFRILSQIRMSFRQGTASVRCSPDFLIIGAQRCGSSTLYNSLVKHTSVLPAIYKEVHYYDINYWRGEKWYHAHFPLVVSKELNVRTTGRNIITGEASPYYLFHPSVPQRISQTLPNIKFIVLLRNPVDRAYSHYNTMFKRGHENLSFEEAIRVETDRLNAIDDEDFRNPKFVSNSHKRYSYLSRGRYAEQLNRWFKRFSREQLLIIQSESLFTDANAELQRVSEFLGLTDQSPLKIANRGSYSPMNTQTRTQLLAYFEPYNHDLFGLLGEEFDWS